MQASSASSPVWPNGVWPRSWPSATASARSSSTLSARASARAICATSIVWVRRVRKWSPSFGQRPGSCARGGETPRSGRCGPGRAGIRFGSARAARRRAGRENAPGRRRTRRAPAARHPCSFDHPGVAFFAPGPYLSSAGVEGAVFAAAATKRMRIRMSEPVPRLRAWCRSATTPPGG